MNRVVAPDVGLNKMANPAKSLTAELAPPGSREAVKKAWLVARSRKLLGLFNCRSR